MRTTLEYVLNNGRHFGGSTAPESDPDLVSGSQYVVTNSGDSISISVSPSTTNLDRFAILPEAYLSKQAALTYWLSLGGPRYAIRQTRSVNKLLGNMGDFDGTYYGVGDVDFSGLYSSVTYQATWKHLEGTWNAEGGTLDFIKDYADGRYVVRANNVPVRELQFSSDNSATSPDYVWSAHVWQGRTVVTEVTACLLYTSPSPRD